MRTSHTLNQNAFLAITNSHLPLTQYRAVRVNECFSRSWEDTPAAKTSRQKLSEFLTDSKRDQKKIQGDKWNKYQAAANIMTRPKGPKFCLMRTKNMRTALEEINFPQIRKRVQELKHNGPITAYTDASTVRGHPNSGWGIVFIHDGLVMIFAAAWYLFHLSP